MPRKTLTPTASNSDSLTAAIRANLPPPLRGTQRWHLRIPAEILIELEEVKAEMLAGKLQTTKRALATVISEQLRSRGICVVGAQGVEVWLRNG